MYFIFLVSVVVCESTSEEHMNTKETISLLSYTISKSVAHKRLESYDFLSLKFEWKGNRDYDDDDRNETSEIFIVFLVAFFARGTLEIIKMNSSR